MKKPEEKNAIVQMEAPKYSNVKAAFMKEHNLAPLWKASEANNFWLIFCLKKPYLEISMGLWANYVIGLAVSHNNAMFVGFCLKFTSVIEGSMVGLYSALNEACSKGFLSIVSQLLGHKRLVERLIQYVDCNDCLFNAASKGHFRIVSRLINAGIYSLEDEQVRAHFAESKDFALLLGHVELASNMQFILESVSEGRDHKRARVE